MAATADSMLAALNVQRAAFTQELPVSIAARKDRLKRAIAMMVDHGAAFANAMSEDFGHRSIEQSMITDVIGSINPIKHTIKQLEKWMRPERRKLQFPLGLLGARGTVEYQPKGVVGIIAPWNFPVQLTMAPMAGAFAAGNRVMVKSSEFTP
ncbi:MAG: aldehyde dehydrogenase family protein, partial [Pseudomonadota bacterium]